MDFMDSFSIGQLADDNIVYNMAGEILALALCNKCGIINFVFRTV